MGSGKIDSVIFAELTKCKRTRGLLHGIDEGLGFASNRAHCPGVEENDVFFDNIEGAYGSAILASLTRPLVVLTVDCAAVECIWDNFPKE